MLDSCSTEEAAKAWDYHSPVHLSRPLAQFTCSLGSLCVRRAAPLERIPPAGDFLFAAKACWSASAQYVGIARASGLLDGKDGIGDAVCIALVMSRLASRLGAELTTLA